VTAHFVDYDNDGLPDLYTVPGGIYRQDAEHRFSPSPELAAAIPRDASAVFCAWFDANNDGWRDLLVSLQEKATGRSTKLYLNQGSGNHWLQVKLVGPVGNRQAIGARVRVTTPDGEQLQPVGSSEGSRHSKGHYRLYFGLGRHAMAEALEVEWADGSRQKVRGVRADRLVTVEYGDGEGSRGGS
jgi:hypothetical protein